MTTPEWSIFDRLDEVEKITLELMERADTTEPSLKELSTLLKDGVILLKNALLFTFATASKGRDTRKLKDAYISVLKSAGLSRNQLESMHESLLEVCEAIDKRQK